MVEISEFVKKFPIFELVIERTLKIFVIFVVMIMLAKLIKFITKKSLKFAENRAAKKSRNQSTAFSLDSENRITTVVHLLDTTLRVTLFGIAILMILRELGLDITPLLTGAGIAGVAVGFGAQSLVKDIISGIFILLEDQLRIGDAVVIAGFSGTVERLELRTTSLRDADGTLHLIPNGEIKTVSNKTYDYSVAIVNIPLSYQVDIQKTVQIVESFAKKLNFCNPLQINGITAFNLNSMEFRVSVVTEPSLRAGIEQELRFNLYSEFSKAGISLPTSRS